jgi:Leucine-rich repeat (LRR) protein
MQTLVYFTLLFFAHQQASSFEVTCKYQTINWSHIGAHYQCYIDSLNVTEPSQIISNISGTHLQGQSRYDVKSVHIIGPGVCNYIPLGLTIFFPNLKGIQLHNCKLQSVCSFDLMEFTNIVVLGFNFNQLTTLPSRVFRHNPNLKYLSLNNNRLKFIHENIFDDLKFLDEAYFDQQICSGVTLTGKNRNDVQYVVERTILEKCQAKDIHEKCEQRQRDLSKVYCSDEFPHVDEHLRRKIKFLSSLDIEF